MKLFTKNRHIFFLEKMFTEITKSKNIEEENSNNNKENDT